MKSGNLGSYSKGWCGCRNFLRAKSFPLVGCRVLLLYVAFCSSHLVGQEQSLSTTSTWCRLQWWIWTYVTRWIEEKLYYLNLREMFLVCETTKVYLVGAGAWVCSKVSSTVFCASMPGIEIRLFSSFMRNTDFFFFHELYVKKLWHFHVLNYKADWFVGIVFNDSQDLTNKSGNSFPMRTIRVWSPIYSTFVITIGHIQLVLNPL